ncbi:MAG: hypothetical protein ACRCT1_00980 [Microcoleaceae cyanobacterium]|jgi:hypothetical protein
MIFLALSIVKSLKEEEGRRKREEGGRKREEGGNDEPQRHRGHRGRAKKEEGRGKKAEGVIPFHSRWWHKPVRVDQGTKLIYCIKIKVKR